MNEEWRPVPEAPGYEVSNLGRVRSWLPHNGQPVPRIRRLQIGSAGYWTVGLHTPAGHKLRRVHTLLAAAFIGPRPEGAVVRHLDGDPLNCVLENLKYGTPSENVRDEVAHRTHRETRKTHCPAGHPYDEDNTLVLSNGWRKCRACIRSRYVPNAECPKCGKTLLRTSVRRHLREVHDLVLGRAR